MNLLLLVLALGAGLGCMILYRQAKEAKEVGSKDRALLDFLDEECEWGKVSLGVEFAGGVYIKVDRPGGVRWSVREQNTAREALAQAKQALQSKPYSQGT